MINKEIGLLKKVDLIITVSEREKRGLNNINNIVVWGHPVVVKNPENGFHERKDINLLHQPFTKDHHITLQSIKSEAITMLKVVILAMCFEGDIAFVISELKAKASLREFRGVHDVPDAKEVYRFTVDQFV